MIIEKALAVCLLLSQGLVVSGQDSPGFSDVLARKFTQYCKSFPREEMYVHTDREEYVAGEEIWFTAYVFDRTAPGLSGGSSLAYIEILNPENRPVVQKRIRLESGTGPGMLELPDSLSTGIYTFRAYTGWMKNFLPGNCFMKPVYISNALSGKKYNTGGLAQPEISESLKQGLTTGSEFSVLTGRDRSGNIRLTISSTGSYRTASGNTLFLFIRTNGVINLNKPVSLPADSTVITIPKDLLSPGINHMTLFSIAGRPVFQKLFYTPEKAPVSPVLGVAPGAGPRQEIEVELNIGTYPGSIRQFSISVSAAGGRTFPGINDYMVFGSEYGQIPEELWMAIRDGRPADSIDMMIGGLRSSWIDWNYILSSQKPETRYSRETTAHYIHGRLLDRSTQVPDSGQILFLSVPGKNASFRYAVTDRNGYFRFEVPVDQNYRDLIIQPEDNTRNNNIRLESPFSEKYPLLLKAQAGVTPYEPVAGAKLAVNYQVMKIYGSERQPEKDAPASFAGGTHRFYGKPDIELVLADYIKLPVMHEVFFELMPGVFMKERKGIYEISVFDPVDNRAYDKPPVVFVDGVVVKDPGVIAGLDPELVEKIDAVKSRYFIGEYLFFGLVNVITKAGDFSNVPLPDQAIRIAYQAYGQAKAFSAPDYSNALTVKSRIPDFRNTLYWNPAIRAGNDLNFQVRFWTSDFRGDFEVLVQGVAGGGKAFSCRKIMKVQ